ncbi:hypothetical protein DSECCO2_450510 [anaerobic digester metagenome]
MKRAPTSSADGSTTSRSTLRPTAPDRHRPRSGWTMSPMVPVAPGGSDDVYTLTPRLHSNSGESVNENAGRNGDDSPIGDICTGICTEESTHLHCLPKTQIAHPGASDPSPRACEIRAGANIPTIREDVPPIREQPAAESLLKCKVECKGVQTSVKVQTSARINPRDYVALPVEKGEPEPASAAADRRRRCSGAGGSTSATTA